LSAVSEVTPGVAYFAKVRTASTWTPPLPRDPTTRFVYDGDGGRVKRIDATGTTRYLGELVETAPDGTTTKYVFAGSQRIAALETPRQQAALKSTRPRSAFAQWWRGLLHGLACLLDLPTAEAAGLPSTIRFYHPDHLGSTHLMTDATGAVIERAEYTPYGSFARREVSPSHSATLPHHSVCCVLVAGC
jgi:hypothetical protein